MKSVPLRTLIVGLLALLLVLGIGLAPAAAQGQLSVQVLQLLSRVNTWIAKQTFQDLRMSPAAVPSDTTNRIYADVPGNLYYNGGLIAGAGGGVTPHNLLSTTHPDTLAGSPTRGAVVVGNSTSVWAAVTIGAAGRFFRSDGTDATWGTDASGLTNIPAAALTGTAAAINGSNITALNASNLASGTVPLARLSGITNTQIDNAAAILYSKLALTGGIVNADINPAAAIAYAKLALTTSIVNGDLTDATLTFAKWASNGCVTTQVPQYNGASWVCATVGTGNGSVTSVGLSMPSFITVTGSPVTSAGTLTGTLASQSQNLMFASPNGGAGAPAFRALLNADLPASGVVAGTNSLVTVNAQGIVTTLAQANIVTNTTGTLSTARGGTSLTAAADDNVMVGNGTNWAAQLLPNCVGGPLGYTQATNVFNCATFRDLIPLIPAVCTAAPAAMSAWSLPSVSAASAVCTEGSNTLRGTLDYAQAVDLTAQHHLKLPSDWVTPLDINIYWFSATTAGDVQWSVSTACNAAGATGDPAFNAANTVTTTVAGTTNQYLLSSITSLTTTGCAAGRVLYLKLERNAGAGADTMLGTARVADVELVVRRALQ